MSEALRKWADTWGVSRTALEELSNVLCPAPTACPDAPKKSEAAVQAAVRKEASQKGMRMFRNNVGGFYDDRGHFVRYGLANDSAAVNKTIKSGDLIGIRPVTITSAHVGSVIGQFVSREVKASNWKFAGTERERAQLQWALLITSLGGDAAFCNSEGTL